MLRTDQQTNQQTNKTIHRDASLSLDASKKKTQPFWPHSTPTPGHTSPKSPPIPPHPPQTPSRKTSTHLAIPNYQRSRTHTQTLQHQNSPHQNNTRKNKTNSRRQDYLAGGSGEEYAEQSEVAPHQSKAVLNELHYILVQISQVTWPNQNIYKLYDCFLLVRGFPIFVKTSVKAAFISWLSCETTREKNVVFSEDGLSVSHSRDTLWHLSNNVYISMKE